MHLCTALYSIKDGWLACPSPHLLAKSTKSLGHSVPILNYLHSLTEMHFHNNHYCVCAELNSYSYISSVVSVFQARGGGMETVTFTRPLDSRLEHVDFSILFSTLPPRKIIQLISSMFMERRIILCSSNLRSVYCQ